VEGYYLVSVLSACLSLCGGGGHGAQTPSPTTGLMLPGGHTWHASRSR
jgi:hypothetical protein